MSLVNNVLKYDWYFHRGDVQGVDAPIDDSWQKVRVPHDWAIEGPFDEENDKQYIGIEADGVDRMIQVGRTGGLPSYGVSWYQRNLNIDESLQGKRIYIDFDGVMSNSTVYINGVELGTRPFGYISFSYEVTDFVKFGEDNKLVVRVAPEAGSSRWYPGAGIYRNVYLRVENTTHVAKHGTYITTELHDGYANVNIETTISGDTIDYTLKTEVYAGECVVASKDTKLDSDVTKQTLKVENPNLWSVDSPNLYTAKSTLLKDGVEQSVYNTRFGIRSIRFDLKEGFFLNDEYMKLKGVCMHHDLGALGSAVNKRATERQLEILRNMGCNSIRTSHNPPSVELLDLCDEMGFLVLDEAFDEWRYAKVPNGYHKYFAEWAEKDLTDFIIRDRNHPSIIMWSIGNEIVDQTYADGKDTARFLTDICHRVDSTRPVTAGFNDSEAAIENGLAGEVDIPGLNYKPHLYEKYTKEHPEWIMYGSETESCVSSRGVYHFPVKEDIPSTIMEDLHLTSYDMTAPGWAYPPDREFEAQDRMKNILGEYVWTGFDYIGEPTPYYKEWPSRSSYFGIVDLCGLPKDRYYTYLAKWTYKDVLHIMPHWDFVERIGEVTPVHVYTNYNKGELFVNGKSQGMQKKNDTNEYTKNRLMWDDVVYEPGEIRVVVYDDNDNVAMEKIVKTSKAPAKIVATADRATIDADGDDLSFITLEVQDSDGNFCARANNLVDVEVTGAGELLAVDNGDQTSIKPFKRNQIECFSGKAVIIIRSKLNESGDIMIKLSSRGLESTDLTIKTK